MKKLFFTAAALFAFAFTNAQETKFGLKTGLNISNWGADAEDTSSKVGLQVGMFVEIKSSDKLIIQPELLYSSLGIKEDIEGTTVNFNTNYLVLPVMFKYLASEKFSLEAGPQIGFLLSAKAKANGNSGDIKDEFNSTDFGINIGAGYDVSEKVNLSLRYTSGISNILKDIGDNKVTNTNIAFALGYKF
jgi:Outer membrane protein beta-barrel domain